MAGEVFMANLNTLGDVIRKIAQDHGEKVLLDSQFTLAVFMDLAPNLKKRRNFLDRFYSVMVRRGSLILD